MQNDFKRCADSQSSKGVCAYTFEVGIDLNVAGIETAFRAASVTSTGLRARTQCLGLASIVFLSLSAVTTVPSHRITLCPNESNVIQNSETS